MKLSNFSRLSIIVLFLISTSCASILAPRKQDIQINTNDSATSVYIDDSLYFKGSSEEVEFKKDMYGHQIRVEKDGYEDKNYVISQTKRSPLYILSIIPFGIMLYPILYDLADNAYKYDKNAGPFTASSRQEVNKKDNWRYIFVNQTSFNVDKEDMRFINLSWRSYNKDFESARESASSYRNNGGLSSIEISNSIFTEALNEALSHRNFIDSSKSILKNQTNTLYVSAEVEGFEVYSISKNFLSKSTPTMNRCQMTLKWKVQDIYKKELFSYTDVVLTDEYTASMIRYKPNGDQDEDDKDSFTRMFEDAFGKSLNNLLETSDMKEVIEINENEKELESVNIQLPKSKINTLGEASKATVTIKTENGHGSGFYINNQGYLITNYHVIATTDPEDLIIIDNADKEHKNVEIIRTDEFNDLAILKIDEQNAFSFDLSESLYPKIGADIYAIGTPSNIELSQTLSKGIISGERTNDQGQKFYQTDASVNGGNSGGPVVNKSGRLLGVVNAKLIGVGVEGIGFCIPAARVVENLKLEYN